MDAAALLAGAGLEPTPKRLAVLRALMGLRGPATPLELLEAPGGLGGSMNRVTLYRILDLFVGHGVVVRHNAGERAFRYCVRTGPAGHAHFTCTRCGHTQCLGATPLELGLGALLSALPMRVDTAEIRLGGVCQGCLGASA